VSTFPWSAGASKTTSSSNFTSGFIAFHFFAVFFSSLADYLFQLSVLIKCNVGTSLGGKEAALHPTLLSAWELNDD
jgi:hypothetical protein